MTVAGKFFFGSQKLRRSQILRMGFLIFLGRFGLKPKEIDAIFLTSKLLKYSDHTSGPSVNGGLVGKASKSESESQIDEFK